MNNLIKSLVFSSSFLFVGCSAVYPNAYEGAKPGTVYQSPDIYKTNQKSYDINNSSTVPISEQQNNPVFTKDQPSAYKQNQINYLEPMIWSLVGSVAGAAIGSQIGGGTGNTIAISTGSVLGGYVGSMAPYYYQQQ